MKYLRLLVHLYQGTLRFLLNFQLKVLIDSRISYARARLTQLV
jgi:hypothetical protein